MIKKEYCVKRLVSFCCVSLSTVVVSASTALFDFETDDGVREAVAALCRAMGAEVRNA